MILESHLYLHNLLDTAMLSRSMGIYFTFPLGKKKYQMYGDEKVQGVKGLLHKYENLSSSPAPT